MRLAPSECLVKRVLLALTTLEFDSVLVKVKSELFGFAALVLLLGESALLESGAVGVVRRKVELDRWVRGSGGALGGVKLEGREDRAGLEREGEHCLIGGTVARRRVAVAER